MRLINKKGDAATSETPYVVLSIVLLVLGISIFVILKANFLNDVSARETLCYLSNTAMSAGGVYTIMPHLCSLEIIEEDKNIKTEEFASLVRRTWWMYLQGEEDLGNEGDEVYLVYQFTPAEDIKLEDYFQYILTHNNDAYISDISKTDYAYLEKNTQTQTLCFDKTNAVGATGSLYLAKGEKYYIIYLDDQPPTDNGGDKILITSSSDFDAGAWRDNFPLINPVGMVMNLDSVKEEWGIGDWLGYPVAFLTEGGPAFVLGATNDPNDKCVRYPNYFSSPKEETS